MVTPRSNRLAGVFVWLAIAASAACQADDGTCRGTGDCRPDEVCVGGVCREVCNSNLDCEGQERCQSGICRPSADDAGARDRLSGDRAVARDASAADSSVADGHPDGGPRDSAPWDAALPDALMPDRPSPDASRADVGSPTDAGAADHVGGDVGASDGGGPLSATLTADPGVVEYGGTTTLSWNSVGAAACEIDGVAVLPAGTLIAAVRSAHTYVLTCTSGSTEVSDEAEVAVSCSSGTSVQAPALPVQSAAELAALVQGVTGCFEIVGQLVIVGSDLVDLGPLTGLVRVDGSLEIHGNAALTSLSGLESLQQVVAESEEGGDLRVGRWDEILGALGNPALAGVAGLSGLRQVDGDLSIEFNDGLVSLGGLEELRAVGGDLSVTHSFLLPDLHGLDRLGRVGRSLVLRLLDALVSLDGLEALGEVGWSVQIEYVPWLEDLSALSSLELADGLVLVQLPMLHWLTGLEGLRGLRRLELNSTGLVDLAELEGAYSASLSILRLLDNPALSDITVLHGVVEVAGDPTSCTGWPRDNHTCVGSVVIAGNAHLSSLAGLEGLEGVGVELHIKYNDLLADLQTLGGLRSVGDNLTISDNANLGSLSGLSGLEACGGNLTISDNISLATLGLPEEVVFTGDSFTVSNNPLLPRQQACDLALVWTGSDPCNGETGPCEYLICQNMDGVACP